MHSDAQIILDLPGGTSSNFLVSLLCTPLFFIYLFIYGCAGSSLLWWAFSSYGKQGLFVAEHKLLIAVASLVAEHGL